MKNASHHLRPALVFLVLLSLLFGGVYPALCTAIIQMLFPAQAQGSLIEVEGKVVGSQLLGQNFTEPKYFWGRLSATAHAPYNAAASGGSNLAAENPALLDAARKRIEALQEADPKNKAPVPVDLVTTSASGLDPHISPAAAEYQIPRVARARHMSEEKLRGLVMGYTEERQWGIFGEPRVNVLLLNLALDKAAH